MTQTQDPKRKLAHGPTVHAIKRAKYEAKQQRLLRLQQTETSSCAAPPSFLQQETIDKWFHDRRESAVFVTAEDVRAIRQRRQDESKRGAEPQGDSRNYLTMDDSSSHKEAFAETQSEVLRLDRIAAWIDPFFDLKEVPKARTLVCTDNNHNPVQSNSDHLFIAEGTEAVRLMIQKCVKTPQDVATHEMNHATTENDCAEEEFRSAPPVRIVSILCKPATFFEQPVCLVDELVKQNFLTSSSSLECDNPPVSQCPFKIIVGNEETLSEIVGFPLARGAMACGIVPRFQHPLRWLKGLLSRGASTSRPNTTEPSNDNATIAKQATTKNNVVPNPQSTPTRILALDAISNTSNMGSILRTAAAFGVDAIVLSDDSCDAWYRQAVRVSMGHVVTVPTIRVGELRKEMMLCDGRNMVMEEDGKCGDGGLPRVLKWLREDMRMKCFAAVVDTDEDATGTDVLPPLVSLESIIESTKDDSSNSWVCVLGNEGHGIREEVVKEVNCRIRIGMANGVDSLSLPVAAGILIHGLSLNNKVK
ncbi:hypothetical protein HJC23_000423 [Cyclotella cryptica]|uniref:tRNA/rRNA methyltransferase SpoU type domain-containing protein n=1 Tax=Cyclotella cryptica TaxID=29204 RepID=A0ABD3QFY4_9STRA|eukprot:CCRYP_007164-RA/>CCRYP_007164-RA protein AED:0.39 eAED:0.39 QI:0/-1/0/1/-1/1/1/0/531